MYRHIAVTKNIRNIMINVIVKLNTDDCVIIGYDFEPHGIDIVDQLNDRKVVIVNPWKTDADERCKIASIMFNRFKVSDIAFLPKAHVNLFSSAKSSGLVVTLGESSVTLTPIIDGYTFSPGILELEVGYQDIVSTVFKKFIERGYAMASNTDWEITKDVVNTLCYFSLGDEDIDLQDVYYDLPSGGLMYIGEEQTVGPEVLFQPGIAELSGPGLSQGIWESINKVNKSHRSNLYSNILVSGPGAQIHGIGERLFKELKEGDDTMRNISVTVCKDPDIVWNNALDILKTGTVSWISKEQYDEFG